MRTTATKNSNNVQILVPNRMDSTGPSGVNTGVTEGRLGTKQTWKTSSVVS